VERVNLDNNDNGGDNNSENNVPEQPVINNSGIKGFDEDTLTYFVVNLEFTYNGIDYEVKFTTYDDENNVVNFELSGTLVSSDDNTRIYNIFGIPQDFSKISVTVNGVISEIVEVSEL
jgi:hypothetical protein